MKKVYSTVVTVKSEGRIVCASSCTRMNEGKKRLVH
jgi:hypothetical protein